MHIIFLYSELNSYMIPIFEHLVNTQKCKVTVFRWDKHLLKPFQSFDTPIYSVYNKSDFTTQSLISTVLSINPSIVYVSGWMDYAYLKCCYYLRKKNIPVVAGIDDKWNNSLRQIIGSIVVKNIIKDIFISHFWVAGHMQYEYAKRMGFNDKKIIFDLLSVDFYTEKPICNFDNKIFLYVGNFRKIKGFDILLEAYKIYKEKFNGKWNLLCIGNGELLELANDIEGVKILPFQKKQDLIQLSLEASVFVLPSRNDMWGVVVQEFASLGFPLLVSENVGSKSFFCIKNFNSRIFYENCPNNLASEMKFYSELNKNELVKMGYNSLKLSKKSSVETACANLLSIL